MVHYVFFGACTFKDFSLGSTIVLPTDNCNYDTGKPTDLTLTLTQRENGRVTRTRTSEKVVRSREHKSLASGSAEINRERNVTSWVIRCEGVSIITEEIP